MTEEEARELEQANTDLKEQVAQKDRRIQELEARLMGAVLRIEELERQQRKDSHNSSKPPSSDGLVLIGKRVANPLVDKQAIRGTPFCKSRRQIA